MQKYDTIIIGGGFYGLRLAQFLHDELAKKNILVLEKESDVMSRASYNNQARVHGGYHYPRSLLTALRSMVNMPVFSKEYAEAIVDNFTHYYAIAADFSHVSARQFQRFCDRINAPTKAAHEVKRHFEKRMIEDIFEVHETAFNSSVLKQILLRELSGRNIEILTSCAARSVTARGERLIVATDEKTFACMHVLNTAYSSINRINAASGLPIIPLKHELAEICLVELPADFSGTAFTVMCGPFFSIMPFPDHERYSISHVRYTPHSEWHDAHESGIRDSHAYLDEVGRISHFPQMIADVKRFMPELGAKIRYSGESLWEVKTVLPQSESDDSRPILYRERHGNLRNYACIMGGKMDNIYDVLEELRLTYGKTF